jgi:ribosomal protein L31
MSQKEQKVKKQSTSSKPVATKAQPKHVKDSKPTTIKYHRIEVKCTNGKSFYTYSTIGKENETVVISAYADPFVHEVWNKDKKRTIRTDSPFTKRFGTLSFAKKEETEDKN